MLGCICVYLFLIRSNSEGIEDLKAKNDDNVMEIHDNVSTDKTSIGLIRLSPGKLNIPSKKIEKLIHRFIKTDAHDRVGHGVFEDDKASKMQATNRTNESIKIFRA